MVKVETVQTKANSLGFNFEHGIGCGGNKYFSLRNKLSGVFLMEFKTSRFLSETKILNIIFNFLKGYK